MVKQNPVVILTVCLLFSLLMFHLCDVSTRQFGFYVLELDRLLLEIAKLSLSA